MTILTMYSCNFLYEALYSKAALVATLCGITTHYLFDMDNEEAIIVWAEGHTSYITQRNHIL